MPRSSRQRQTRLAFTPLPSSSPAAQGYHKQIRDRAAAVTLSTSPGSQRQRGVLRDVPKSVDAVNHIMPTPASDQERPLREARDDGSNSESDSEPVRHSQRRAHPHSTPRQQRIDFSHARDPSSFSPSVQLRSSTATSKSRPSTQNAGMFSSQPNRVVVSSDTESEEEEAEEEQLSSTHKARSRLSSTKQNGRVTRSQQTVKDSDEDEEDTVVVQPRPSSTRVQSDNEDEDEDDMPTTVGTQRRKRVARVPSDSPNSFIASSPPHTEDSDDDLEIIAPPSKRQRRSRPRSDSEVEEENEDDEEPCTPSRRGLKSRKLSQRQQAELDEDLDFLGPSSDVEASARKSRDSRTMKSSVKQKALEALKRKRSGRLEGSADVEELTDGSAQEDDEEEEEYLHPTRSSQMFQEDEDDIDFVESDQDALGAPDEDTLGVPGGHDIPIEFTSYASMKPKELFKFAVDWFVQKKINPGFQMDDPLYTLTFRKLDDEVTGLAASKFKSSAWKDDFVHALNARPQIAHEELDRAELLHDTCDACNRTGHPASFQVQFHGEPYDRQTLEDLPGNEEGEEEDDDEDSESETRSDKLAWDADGHEIAPETKTWYVGRFCMSNAQTAHALQHWRYHLNEWVVTWLAKNGYNNPDEVVKRDSLSTKKRRKYASRIVKLLEQEGVVKTLYRDYKNNIDSARNSKQGRYSAWR